MADRVCDIGGYGLLRPGLGVAVTGPRICSNRDGDDTVSYGCVVACTMWPLRSNDDIHPMNSLQQFPSEGLTTERLLVRPVTVGDAPALLDFHLRNRAHLQPWEPLRTDDFYSLNSTQLRLAASTAQMQEGLALHLLLVARATGETIGTCNFSNVIRGAFQACHLGFSVAQRAQGHGYMLEGVGLAIEEVFARFDLHRVMANYRPENHRSAALLGKLGFEREGMARSYLKINGAWTDHVLTARINPAH